MSANKVNDEELKKVSGGMVSDEILDDDFGKEIICPACLSTKWVIPGSEAKARTGIEVKEKYFCTHCNYAFGDETKAGAL